MSNTFVTPRSVTTLSQARVDYNNSLTALLQNFASPGAPGAGAVNMEGATGLKEGMFWFKSGSNTTLGQGRTLVYRNGQFVRDVVYTTASAVSANVAASNGNLLVGDLVDIGDNRLYRVHNSGQYIVDVGIPPVGYTIGNANLLDNLDSEQFLRSDAADTATQQLTFTHMLNLSNSTATSTSAAALWLSASAGALMIDNTGQKRISWSDGGSSLGVYSGSYFNSGVHKYTTTLDGAAQMLMDTDSAHGIVTIRVADRGTAEATPVWKQTVRLTNSAFTINSNTIWHAGNDGASSGLDADLLDGTQLVTIQNAYAANDGVTINSARANDWATWASAQGNDHATLLTARANDFSTWNTLTINTGATLNTARANDFNTYNTLLSTSNANDFSTWNTLTINTGATLNTARANDWATWASAQGNDHATLLTARANDWATWGSAQGNDHATLLTARANDFSTWNTITINTGSTLNTARANDWATWVSAQGNDHSTLLTARANDLATFTNATANDFNTFNTSRANDWSTWASAQGNDHVTLLSARANDGITLATARGNDHSTLLSARANDWSTYNTLTINTFATWNTLNAQKANIHTTFLTDASDIDNIPNGLYGWTSGANSPVNAPFTNVVLLQANSTSISSQEHQLIFASNRLATRRAFAGVWDAWQEYMRKDVNETTTGSLTVSGGLVVNTGTAAAPSITFSGDTNTGMYRFGADSIGFTTNSNVAAVITSAGNFRLYNTAGTFYNELASQPTANRTITIPDVTGTIWTTGNDSTLVKTSGDQTIQGLKSFVGSGDETIRTASSGATASPFMSIYQGGASGTRRAYIQYINGGTFRIRNEGSASGIDFSTGDSGLLFYNGSINRTVYHSGNEASTGFVRLSGIQTVADKKTFTTTVGLNAGYDNPNPGGGDVSVNWNSNYLRYRFGGTANPLGITISDYDTTQIILARNGNITLNSGAFTALGSDAGLFIGTVNTGSNLVRGARILNQTGYTLMQLQATSSASDTTTVCSNWKGATQTMLWRVNGNFLNLNNSYGGISDINLKTDIEPASNQLEDLRKIEIVKFRLKSGEPDSPKHTGVIAQDIQEIKPGLVEQGEDGILSVKYSVLSVLALKALQELADKVDAIEARLQTLESA
jgi:hypothetical protein